MNLQNKILPRIDLDIKNRFRVQFCACGKSNKDGKFVPYVGYDNKGYCHSCCQTFLPELKEYNEKWNFSDLRLEGPIVNKVPKKSASLIPLATFKESLDRYKENNFVKYLTRLFGSETTKQLVEKYFIGTSAHWSGSTIFWHININGTIRAGKIMLYNAVVGKRIKEPFNYANWIHSVLNLPQFILQQCFFGEHLLKGNKMPVAIVESEKTAILASVYLPQFIWIAAGNKDGLNKDKCKVLKGRKVVLYPDLNAFELWSKKAKEFSNITSFSVSNVLELYASKCEKEDGLDLADYLIKFPVSDFKTEHIEISSKHILPGFAEHHTTEEFNFINSTFIRTHSGLCYDVLFNEYGNLIEPGEQCEAVNYFAKFYKKNLQSAMLDNTPCWVHVVKLK